MLTSTPYVPPRSGCLVGVAVGVRVGVFVRVGVVVGGSGVLVGPPVGVSGSGVGVVHAAVPKTNGKFGPCLPSSRSNVIN